MLTHTKKLVMRGELLDNARRAIILVHGRGATAEDILTLGDELDLPGFSLLAPQAADYSWYPYSFIAPVQNNEPALSSALAVLGEIVDDALAAGIHSQDLYFLGFSQGACLVSEFAARNARRYGGVFILSGGVIGQEIDESHYQGQFYGTPIFLGCSDRDPHIPLQRVKDTSRILRERGAEVTERIYPGMPHTVTLEEINEINQLLKH